MKHAIVSCVLAIMMHAFFGGGAPACAQTVASEESPLVIQVKTDRMIYRLDDTVTVTIYLRNISDEPLSIVEPAIDKRSLYVEIMQPDGKKDKMIDIYGLMLKTIELPPRKRVRFTATFVPEMIGSFDVKVRYYGFGEEPITASPVRLFVVAPPPSSPR